MIFTKPYFFDSFKCKADKCTDSCCIGWEIDIDQESYEKYKSVSDEFCKQLMNGIDEIDNQHCFKLSEHDRCIFLMQNGLCDIYSNLGEEYLCEICREHPRFYDFFENVTEMGLGLCCEKVCEMIFVSDEPVTFISHSDNINDGVDEDTELFFLIREKCFEIIYDRKKPLQERIYDLIVYGLSVQNELFSDEYDVKFDSNKKNIFRAVIRLFSETEPINEEWTDYIRSFKNEIGNIIGAANFINTKEYEYEQMLTYILYRHFVRSRFDGNILSVICFSVISVIFIYLCDCKTFYDTKMFSHTDRINNVKMWSKQIEYSDVNTQLILDSAIDVLLKNI